MRAAKALQAEGMAFYRTQNSVKLKRDQEKEAYDRWVAAGRPPKSTKTISQAPAPTTTLFQPVLLPMAEQFPCCIPISHIPCSDGYLPFETPVRDYMGIDADSCCLTQALGTMAGRDIFPVIDALLGSTEPDLDHVSEHLKGTCFM